LPSGAYLIILNERRVRKTGLWGKSQIDNNRQQLGNNADFENLCNKGMGA
jgi:hypothetical protein